MDERTAGASGGDEIMKTINQFTDCWRTERVEQGAFALIVDTREFQSTLPSLLHVSTLLVIPATSTVGDYIITPDICVERKSVLDLIQNFPSEIVSGIYMVSKATQISKQLLVRTSSRADTHKIKTANEFSRAKDVPTRTCPPPSAPRMRGS